MMREIGLGAALAAAVLTCGAQGALAIPTEDTPSFGAGVDDPAQVVTFTSDPLGRLIFERSADDGASVVLGAAPIRSIGSGNHGPRPLAVLGHGEAILFGSGGTLRRSVDGGATWTSVLSLRGGLGVGAFVRDIVPDPGRPKAAWLVAATPLGAAGAPKAGIWRSLDAGRTWKHVLTSPGCTGVAPQPGTRTVLATCRYQILRSVNRGATFTVAFPKGQALPVGDFESVIVDPARPGVALANGTSPTSAGVARLFRSTTAGRTWKPVALPAVRRQLGRILAQQPGEVRLVAGAGQVVLGAFASGNDVASFLQSGDGGLTWALQSLPAESPKENPVPGRASGSATAIRMPSAVLAEVLWIYRAATGWQRLNQGA